QRSLTQGAALAQALGTAGVQDEVHVATTRPFTEIPSTGNNGWINLLRFWKGDTLQKLHLHMDDSFRKLGPIYREKIGSKEMVNVFLPEDVEAIFHSEDVYPRRMQIALWIAHRDSRKRYGPAWREDRLVLNKEVMSVGAVNKFLPLLDEVSCDFVAHLAQRIERGGLGGSLKMDLYPELFRFTMESSCNVLFGERLGLLSTLTPDSKKFISSIERMFETTLSLMFIPPQLLQFLSIRQWKEQLACWDEIFNHASSTDRKYAGVLAELLEQAKLPVENIIASIIEMMVGGVDTTAVPLHMALFELARNPDIQELVRKQVQAAWEKTGGNAAETLKATPLLRAIIKEILRLYPVGVVIQRIPSKDLVLQNYHIPAGTLVQVSLFSLGRSPQVFSQPLHFQPGRWEKPQLDCSGSHSPFKFLTFGFGSRQCLGRRIAETEMQLFLLHMLKNFRLEVQSKEEIKFRYSLILLPEKVPHITFKLLSAN
uniref:steroid 11beta-monooxygenase n=1 Tax=Erpetoichthys calabaricus TaxID=27687 RepID=A0A8C4RH24_ERPCA